MNKQTLNESQTFRCDGRFHFTGCGHNASIEADPIPVCPMPVGIEPIRFKLNKRKYRIRFEGESENEVFVVIEKKDELPK